LAAGGALSTQVSSHPCSCNSSFTQSQTKALTAAIVESRTDGFQKHEGASVAEGNKERAGGM